MFYKPSLKKHHKFLKIPTLTINNFQKLSPYMWEIPKSYRADMRVPARLYIRQDMLERILDELSPEQLINVATLPGIERYAIAMPDIHQGYGFPIGGVAAIRAEDGVISPGGVGYDINCGVRLLKSPLRKNDITDKVETLANQIQRDVPSGVGRGGTFKLSITEMDEVLNKGVNWAVKKGYTEEEDKDVIEENGCFVEADASFVPEHAKKRAYDQLGTLGAGNHFLEIQEVVQIFDEAIAATYGLFQGQLCVMLHTGSRGLGHETCTQYVRIFNKTLSKYRITLPDRELSSAPFTSPEGQEYFKAMAASANFAWTNRQLITHLIRNAWKKVLGTQHTLDILYDVAHNIAKLETYNNTKYLVHRKGATRAFGPENPEIPQKYQETGQPVLIPGSMGTFSYVLAGTARAMEETFGSSCHGAGRQMSRSKAIKTINYDKLIGELKTYGVIVRGGGRRGIVEEAPQAYKNIADVIDVVASAGIAQVVAKLKPLAVIKG